LGLDDRDYMRQRNRRNLDRLLQDMDRQRPFTPAMTAAAPSGPPTIANKALCQSLDARVNELDAMARQPQTGGTQDWIRMERQKTRDEQFRLRC
jgi:hypothetical protein